MAKPKHKPRKRYGAFSQQDQAFWNRDCEMTLHLSPRVKEILARLNAKDSPNPNKGVIS